MTFSVLPDIPDLVPDDAPILREVQPNFDFTDRMGLVETLLVLMLDTMRHHKAIGLAAPQIGLRHRVFVMEIEGMAARMCFNPEVLSVSEETEKAQEGCLSFPDLWLNVERPIRVEARYQNHMGNLVHETFESLAARCYLHETDHLNGVRFIEKVGAVTLLRARQSRSKKLKKDRR